MTWAIVTYIWLLGAALLGALVCTILLVGLISFIGAILDDMNER